LLPGISDPEHAAKMDVFAKISKSFPHEHAYDVFLEHGMVGQAFDCLNQKMTTSDAILKTSLFFQMMTYLLDKKMLGRYGDLLSPLVPDDFKMSEFCNLYTMQSVELGKGPVFVRNDKELSVGDLKSFLERIL